MVHNPNFGRSKTMVHNLNFGRSKIKFLNCTFKRSKLIAHNGNFGLTNSTRVQIYRYMLSIWQYVYIVLDPSKWTAPNRKNGLCMWAVQSDKNPKLHFTTVILDRPNGPFKWIWTKEPICSKCWTSSHPLQQVDEFHIYHYFPWYVIQGCILCTL